MGVLIGKTASGVSGRVVVSSSPLGSGGEGAVFSVSDHNISGILPAENLVYKKYHSPGEGDRERKVAAMLSNSPDSSSVAWPLASVFDDGVFSGYLMVKLEGDRYRMWSELANIRDRRRNSPDFSFHYAVAAARNLAVVLDSVHSAGHCVGDINESNIFVGSDASILIVDTDSAQICHDGSVFPCLVGKPEYVAPEISHGSFKDNVRTVETDMFAFGVAVTQMLTGGAHPTDGVFLGDGEPPSVLEKNREGIYPVLGKFSGFRSLDRVPSECLPKMLRRVLLAALAVDPSSRVSFSKLIAVFDAVLKNLESCGKVSTHAFDSRDCSSCPWCVRRGKGLMDPWGKDNANISKKKSSGVSQVTLPTVKFQDGSVAPPVRRSAIQTSSPTAASSPRNTAPRNSSGSSQHSAPSSQNFSQHSGNSQTVPQHSGSSQNVSQVQQIPEKIKGKTVLHYADGSWGVRPSLLKLFMQNPGVAMGCVRKEVPGVLSVWWKTERPVASLLGVALGLLIGLVLSGTLFFIPYVVSFFWVSIPDWVVVALPVVSLVCVSVAALSCFHLAGSALRDYFRAWKPQKSVAQYRKDPWWKTVLRFLPIPYSYGIFGVLSIVVFLLYALIEGLTNEVRESRYR